MQGRQARDVERIKKEEILALIYAYLLCYIYLRPSSILFLFFFDPIPFLQQLNFGDEMDSDEDMTFYPPPPPLHFKRE